VTRWRFGCDKEITVMVPRGYSYREYVTRCGSTAYDGGVNQCDDCAAKLGTPPTPREDEGDLEYDDRIGYERGDW